MYAKLFVPSSKTKNHQEEILSCAFNFFAVFMSMVLLRRVNVWLMIKHMIFWNWRF